MKLEDIQLEAEKDLRFDKTKLIDASIDTPTLVNKYYGFLVTEGRILKMIENKLFEVYKELYDYYLHLAPPEVYVAKPFNRKVLKGDVDMYIQSDQLYADMINKIEAQKYKVKYIEEIIKQLNQRTFNIKNIIEAEKFRHGLN